MVLVNVHREEWKVKNRTNSIVIIGDLPKVPGIRPGKKIDLLNFQTKDEIGQSERLISLIKSNVLILTKKAGNATNTIASSEAGDSITSSEIEEATNITDTAISNLTHPSEEIFHPPYVPAQLLDGSGNPIITSLWSEPCDVIDASNWKNVGGGGGSAVLSAETTDFTTYKTNPQSLKLTCEGSDDGQLKNYAERAVTDTPPNLSTAHFKIRFKVLSGTGNADPANIVNIEFWVLSGDFSNYKYWYIMEAEDLAATENQWVDFICTAAGREGTGGTLAWDAISKLRINILTTSATDTPSILIDSIEAWPATDIARCMVSIDDGNRPDQDPKIKYALGHGIPITLFVYGAAVGTSGYYTWDQLWKLKRAGAEIANHSYSHGIGGFTDLSLTEKENEIRRMSDLLIANGFADGARTFAIPNGSFTIGQDEKQYQSGITNVVRRSFSSIGKKMWLNSYTDPAMLFNCSDSFDNDTNYNTYITHAKTHGLLMCASFHAADSDISLADWKTFIDNLKTEVDAGTLKCVKASTPWV